MTLHEPLGTGSAHRQSYETRQNHERRIIARLAGIQGVRCLLGEQEDAIAREDRVDQSLAKMLATGPLEVRALLELALQMAHTLAEIHRRGVLHQNINPGNILVHGPRQTPVLTDFQLAATFAEENPAFTHHRDIRGNLAYLAPEQTGRTGRSVDLRSDLYALGATLYESATGRPPFEAKDPLDLLHDHLARLPVPPAQLREDLPAALSQIIMRLLEKEPARRYQSAEGLAHDLTQMQRRLDGGETSPVCLGERDFPLRLSAPSRLAGRDREIEVLRQALDDAVHGRGRIVLVSGAPGVGKTSLINELRTMVTARRGWFVSGKFDQYRRDTRTVPVQALRALGRFLLAEPDAELAAQRERIIHALGPNAGLMCSLPEFALLFGPQPEVPPAEPTQAEGRLLATVVDLLRAIASPERPVVMVLDDLQWAAAVSVNFIEAVLHAPGLPGFLLVGSYRDAEVDSAHPVGAALLRWKSLASAPLQLRLENLPCMDLQEMLQEMMRLPPSQAGDLARAVDEHTEGNPYDTVELLNALRADGALRSGPGGWEWDAATLRRYVGHSGVVDLLAARIARLPPSGQTLMHAMACLGAQVRRGLLSVACGLSADTLDEQLAAPLEDGLLVIEPGEQDTLLRMRHDRVQQAVYLTLEPARRGALHLGMARRLSASRHHSTAAVEQYLSALQDVHDPGECAKVARLFHKVAIRTRSTANYAAMQRLLAAALSLLGRLPFPTADDESLRNALQIDVHMALCTLGQFEEADALYRMIEARGAVENWVEAGCEQIRSLQNRSRSGDAVTLGLSLLQQLGLDVPDDFAAADLEQRLVHLGQWIKHVDLGNDSRPYTGNRRSTAAASLIHRIAYPAFYSNNIRILAWLLLEAQDLWLRHGPSPELVNALASLGTVTIGLNQDFRTTFAAARHVLGVSEARGWGAGTTEARFLCVNHASHWFEPLEETVRQLRLVREEMLRNGELHGACFSFRTSTIALLDCSPTLQSWAEEIEAGLALALRVRNEYVVAGMAIELQLLRDLRGGAPGAGGLAADVQSSLDRLASQPATRLNSHFCRALRAAVFGEMPALSQDAAAAREGVAVSTTYRGAPVRMLQVLALAHRAKTAAPSERSSSLTELDACCDWMAHRAADAPRNFLHLLKWMAAERAWALEDFKTAAGAFDAALCLVEPLTRPWHHALIAERAGLFHLEHGMSKTGRLLIAQARLLYAAWGADNKVRRMESDHAFLTLDSTRGADRAGTRNEAAAVDTIDTLAILRASQALSSETSLARLKTRVTDVMGALTGATAVQFALWDEDLEDWFFSPGDGTEVQRISASDAGARGLVPLSAFRYAERTRESLLVEDATRDDRFARDPYLSGVAQCSLLIVPITNQGSLRGMLVLENRLSRGAFSTGRLDAVMLIAGQLAVSLENALIHDRLEQRVRDQTRELLAAARRDGMAQIATNVLHNVGNVLTSVNVSAHVLEARVIQSRAARVADLAGLLESNSGDLGSFFAHNEKGKVLPKYVRELAEALAGEREDLLGELVRLGSSVDHIKNVVAMQQSYAGASGTLELAHITELVDDALRIQEDALAHQGIRIVREYARVEQVALEKTRVMQILVNLFENARHAMEGVDSERKLSVKVSQEAGWLRVSVSDDGCGIAADNLPRIFSHGFTTKPSGHGFGLHSCALAAKEIGGTLTVHSDGPGKGSTFTFGLPFASSAR